MVRSAVWFGYVIGVGLGLGLAALLHTYPMPGYLDEVALPVEGMSGDFMWSSWVD